MKTFTKIIIVIMVMIIIIIQVINLTAAFDPHVSDLFKGPKGWK